MGQRASEFCTQILTFLKPSFTRVYLRNDVMVI